MKYWALFGLFLLCSRVLYANDGFAGIAGTGGRVRLLAGEHPSIRMEREWVQMHLYPRYYTVSATFLFQNDGPATTVTMGFPEHGERGGDGGGGVTFPKDGQSAYRHFMTTVDAQPVHATRRLIAQERDLNPGSDYQALWMKKVFFARNQRRTVTVSYQAEAGWRGLAGDPNPVARFAVYHFTGGNWKGTVGESQLTIVSHLVGLVGFTPTVPDTPRLAASSVADGIWNYTWRNWQAQGDFKLTYGATEPGYLSLPDVPSPFTPKAWATVIRCPGPLAYPDIMPTVLLRGQTAFIQLYQCHFLLTDDPPAYPDEEVDITWNAQRNEATLFVGRQAISWQPGVARMMVNGIAHPLPAAPFLSAPDSDGGRRLYIPVRAFAAKLKGTVLLDMKARKISVHIPAVKK